MHPFYIKFHFAHKMKLSNLLLLVVFVTISHYATHAAKVVEMNNKLENATSPDDEAFDRLPSTKSGDHISQPDALRGVRFSFESLQKAGLSCSKYPRVCRAKGSAGEDCCKGKCVNVERDRNNCGMCGNKCKYSEICCNGRCVNPMFNRKNCGGCNNVCNKGSLCSYGMCDYA